MPGDVAGFQHASSDRRSELAWSNASLTVRTPMIRPNVGIPQADATTCRLATGRKDVSGLAIVQQQHTSRSGYGSGSRRRARRRAVQTTGIGDPDLVGLVDQPRLMQIQPRLAAARPDPARDGCRTAWLMIGRQLNQREKVSLRAPYLLLQLIMVRDQVGSTQCG